MSESKKKTSGGFLAGVAVAILSAPALLFLFKSEVVMWSVALAPLLVCIARWIQHRDDGVWLGLSTVLAILPYAALAWRLSLPPHTGGP